MDLFVAKGNVGATRLRDARIPSNLLLGQPDGTFVEGADAAGILRLRAGRGAALADLNLDGLLDLVQVIRSEPAAVAERRAGHGRDPGRWATGSAFGWTSPAPNRDAIGAWVEVRVGDRIVQRELTVGGGHASGQLGWIHFGLGPARRPPRSA